MMAGIPRRITDMTVFMNPSRDFYEHFGRKKVPTFRKKG